MAQSTASGTLTADKNHSAAVDFTILPRLIVSTQFIVGGQAVRGVEPRSSARILLTVTQAGLAIVDATVVYEVYTPRGQQIATGGVYYVPAIQAYRMEWLPSWTPDEGEYVVRVRVTKDTAKRTLQLRIPIRYPDGAIQRPRNLELEARIEGVASAVLHS